MLIPPPGRAHTRTQPHTDTQDCDKRTESGDDATTKDETEAHRAWGGRRVERHPGKDPRAQSGRGRTNPPTQPTQPSQRQDPRQDPRNALLSQGHKGMGSPPAASHRPHNGPTHSPTTRSPDNVLRSTSKELRTPSLHVVVKVGATWDAGSPGDPYAGPHGWQKSRRAMAQRRRKTHCKTKETIIDLRFSYTKYARWTRTIYSLDC